MARRNALKLKKSQEKADKELREAAKKEWLAITREKKLKERQKREEERAQQELASKHMREKLAEDLCS